MKWFSCLGFWRGRILLNVFVLSVYLFGKVSVILACRGVWGLLLNQLFRLTGGQLKSGLNMDLWQTCILQLFYRSKWVPVPPMKEYIVCWREYCLHLCTSVFVKKLHQFGRDVLLISSSEGIGIGHQCWVPLQHFDGTHAYLSYTFWGFSKQILDAERLTSTKNLPQ